MSAAMHRPAVAAVSTEGVQEQLHRPQLCIHPALKCKQFACMTVAQLALHTV